MTPRLLQPVRGRRVSTQRMSMLHPECPIEQAVHSHDAVVQCRLLQEIWRRHSFIEEGALPVADPKCLRLLARTEGALRAPIDALRARYGAALIVEPPSVRYAHGAPVLEPYMLVMLSGPARCLPLLQQDLVSRRACIKRLDDRRDPFVLEAEAPLGNLLGYKEWLAGSMDDDTDMTMWLSRYLPIGGDGPRAA